MRSRYIRAVDISKFVSNPISPDAFIANTETESERIIETIKSEDKMRFFIDIYLLSVMIWTKEGCIMTSSWLFRITITFTILGLFVCPSYLLGKYISICELLLIATGILKLYEVLKKKKQEQEP